MGNIYLYYLALLGPLLVLVGIFNYKLLPSLPAVVLLFAYLFIYRTIIDGLRLFNKGAIKKDEIWKIATHGLRSKFFKELYFSK